VRLIGAALCLAAGIVACADREDAARADSPVAGTAVPVPAVVASVPLPFADSGACPFEGCSYRMWKSTRAVDLRSAPSLDSAVAFRLPGNTWVRAVTGAVVTTVPGRVTFKDTVQVHIGGDSVRATPADTLYVLHAEGEGYVTAWFRGRLQRGVDGTGFFEGTCPLRTGCNGVVLNQAKTTWWALIRADSAHAGWTNDMRSFDCTDQLGGSPTCNAHQKRQ